MTVQSVLQYLQLEGSQVFAERKPYKKECL